MEQHPYLIVKELWFRKDSFESDIADCLVHQRSICAPPFSGSYSSGWRKYQGSSSIIFFSNFHGSFSKMVELTSMRYGSKAFVSPASITNPRSSDNLRLIASGNLEIGPQKWCSPSWISSPG